MLLKVGIEIVTKGSVIWYNYTLMLAQFYQKIWAEAYSENDLNIVSLLEKNLNAKVLDVGCGDGLKTIKFKKAIGCGKIAGIDGLSGRLAAAKKRGVDQTTVVNLEKKWPFRNSTFDVIISNQVIEHIADTDNFIKEIRRLLKPGGYCVISTENLASWHNIFALFLGYQDFSHHLIKKGHVGNPLSPHFGEKTVTWSKNDNSGVDDTAHPHLKILTFRSLINIFKAYGFQLEEGLGSGYYPLYGFMGKFASQINPSHAHFITVKFRKPARV